MRCISEVKLASKASTLALEEEKVVVLANHKRKIIQIAMKSIVVSILGAAFVFSSTSVARPRSVPLAQAQTLQSSWGISGFAEYSWHRANDGRELYSSPVYISLSGNSLNIYNTYNTAPLGQQTACGGFGCDLGRGQLLATLTVVPQGTDHYTVVSASQDVDYLQGAQCRINQDLAVFGAFECFSLSGPNIDQPSIYRFIPGT